MSSERRHSGRAPSLFDSCHAGLWDLFVREMDQVNLLRLFRRSSHIWRLRSEVKKEARYLRRFAEPLAHCRRRVKHEQAPAPDAKLLFPAYSELQIASGQKLNRQRLASVGNRFCADVASSAVIDLHAGSKWHAHKGDEAASRAETHCR